MTMSNVLWLLAGWLLGLITGYWLHRKVTREKEIDDTTALADARRLNAELVQTIDRLRRENSDVA